MANTNGLDGVISKSLDELDEIVKGITTDLSKAQNDEDVAPDEVSEDAPEPDTDDAEEGQDGEPDTDADADPDNDGDVDNDAEGEQDTDQDDDNAEKSLESELNGNESVRKALEVSEFLSELVKSMDNVISGQRADLNKSIQAQEASIQTMAKTFAGIAKSQKAVLEINAQLFKSLKAMEKRMASIESQPQVRKSVASSNTKVVEKSFQASAGQAPTTSNDLNKSEVLGKLNVEFRKGNVGLGQDILNYESTGDVNMLSQAARGIVGI